MRDLERRVQRLEAERGADEEVTLEDVVLWSLRFWEGEPPLDAETQRQYDVFSRRFERSKLGRIFKDMMEAVAANRARQAEAVAGPVESAIITPKPAPAAAPSQGNSFWQRGHVYEPDRNDDVLVPQPGMSLAALMAHSRESSR